MPTSPTAVPEFPFRSADGPVSSELHKRYRDLVVAQEQHQAQAAKWRESEARVVELARAREAEARRAASEGEEDTREYASLARQHREAQAQAEAHEREPWDARDQGAHSAVLRARARYEEFVDKHRHELVVELSSEAEEAVAGVQAAAAGVDPALAEHQRVRNAHLALLPRKLRAHRGVVPEVDEMFTTWNRAAPTSTSRPRSR